MEFKQRSLMQLAQLICGNDDANKTFFRNRSSSYLTEFFEDCDTEYVHDGSTRDRWVAEVLKAILAEPHHNANTPPETFSRVIRTLMDQGDAVNENPERKGALKALAAALAREGFESFYADDKQCYVVTTSPVAVTRLASV